MSSELNVVDRNGIMFVTTSASESATASATPTATFTPGRMSVTGEKIIVPKGFASDVGGLINSLLTLVFVISAILVFGSLIWGGFQWITSGGEKGKTDAAKNRIIAAVVGLVILAASYAILTIILRFLGFADLNDVLGSLGTINGASATNSAVLQPIQFVK